MVELGIAVEVTEEGSLPRERERFHMESRMPVRWMSATQRQNMEQLYFVQGASAFPRRIARWAVFDEMYSAAGSERAS